MMTLTVNAMTASGKIVVMRTCVVVVMKAAATVKWQENECVYERTVRAASCG